MKAAALAALAAALLAAACSADAAKMFPRRAGAPGVMDTTTSAATGERFNEIKYLPGHDTRERVSSPRPHEYVEDSALPDNFSWGNVDGKVLLTKSLNQHLPQYCGSCWAHGAMSALADRIKIARKGLGVDINLAIQYILNCGAEVAGSCHGGSGTGAYQVRPWEGAGAAVSRGPARPFLGGGADPAPTAPRRPTSLCTTPATCRTIPACSTPPAPPRARRATARAPTTPASR